MFMLPRGASHINATQQRAGIQCCRWVINVILALERAPLPKASATNATPRESFTFIVANVRQTLLLTSVAN